MKTYKELLTEFISFKSISTDPEYDSEIQSTVNWLSNLFKEHNFDVQVVTGYDNPLVIASYIKDESLPTCLVYGHYDVQPASKEDGWDSEPFELTERDGRYFARGVLDNKGQVLIHIYNVLKLIYEDNLAYNVKFFLEGNEETGSPNMARFMQENSDLVKADIALISDGEITFEHPSIELGFRGVLNCTINVKTSNKDLHSGLYGGVSPNAARELIKILDQLVDDNNKITIEGMYDSVVTPDQASIDANNNIPFTFEGYQENTGTSAILTEPGWEFYNQLAFRPSLEITGLESGYMGVGYRNAIPAKASAKINFRLTAHQEPEEVGKLIVKYIESLVPEYVELEVKVEQLSKGVELNANNDYVEKASSLLKNAYNKDVLLKYCGASLPIVTDFKELLGMDQVLVPLGNEDCNMHAANENFTIDILNKGLEFSYNFFKKS